MKAIVLRALLLVNIALLLALAYHGLRLPDLPLLAAAPQAVPEIPIVSVEETWVLIESGGALLVDARPIEMYDYGHLPGAVPAPLGQEISPPLLERLRSGPLLIVYCDGPACQAGEEQAKNLAEHGLPVRVLKAGWEGWLDAGKPVKLGPP